MPTLADPATCESLITRVKRLSPDSRAQWGRMNVAQMIVHCTDAYLSALGEVPCASRSPWIARTWVMKRLMLDVFPFPKGAPTAPEMLARAPDDWEAEHAKLIAVMRRAQTALPSLHLSAHPFFGPLTSEEWGRLLWKHMDHHLRQFGA